MPPISAANLKLYLSGGAANSDPNASLGGARSSTEIAAATLHNLFDVVSSDEAAAGDIEYRLYYLRNEDAITWTDVVAWITQQTPSGDTDVAISVATEGINGEAQTIADESTAPVGQTFTAPASKGAGLLIGDLTQNDFIGIWVRWTVNAAAAAANADNVIIRHEGDTTA